MDLNLYLGQPSPPPSLGLADFGSDLSLRLLSSSPGTIEVGGAAILMPGSVEPSESRPPYSPSHSEYSPDLFYVLQSHIINSTEYTPFFPYFERYRPPPLSYLLIPVLQDSGGADAAYSPASIEPLLGAREIIEPSLENDHSEPYDPTSPHIFPPEAVAYLPTYLTGSTSSPVHEATDFSFYPPITSVGNFLGGEEGPSLTTETYSCTGAFSERPMESRHRRPVRRFRSLHPQVDERSIFGTLQLPNAEQSRQDTLSSLRTTEGNENHKLTTGSTVAEASEEEDKEKVRNAANFECFICFNMAAEPVVTSCGHLFCWPCLYQWLHVHSDHKECPVCKGKVNDSNITPIYGRGGSPSRPENKTEEDGESALKIPPRPAGNRSESLRQQFRPLSRTSGAGFAASLRRLLDAHVDGANRHESYAEPNVQEIYENVHGRALIRLRARRVQREMQPASGSIAGDLGVPVTNVANPIRIHDDFFFQDSPDFWQPFERSPNRIAAISTDLPSLAGRFDGSDGNDPSTSSLYPNTETPAIWPPTDTALTPEASVSSTMAIILGDAANSEAPADHNSVGSSQNYSRRGRSGISGSLDVDGGTLNSYKRRRLN